MLVISCIHSNSTEKLSSISWKWGSTSDSYTISSHEEYCQFSHVFELVSSVSLKVSSECLCSYESTIFLAQVLFGLVSCHPRIAYKAAKLKTILPLSDEELFEELASSREHSLALIRSSSSRSGIFPDASLPSSRFLRSNCGLSG